MRTRSDRNRAAGEILGALYPPPLQTSLGSSRRRDVRARWLAVPTSENPRLLVSATSSYAAVRTLRRQLSGQRPRTRLARSVLSVAVATGIPFLVPRLRVVVSGPLLASTIEDPIREALGVDAVCLSMPIGPARANRKPVLQIADRHGRVLAFAKVGYNDLTRRLVRHESRALRLLAATPHDAFVAPGVLGTLEWGDLVILLLEPLRIPRRRLTGERGRARLVEVIGQISGIDATPAVPWRDHPYAELLDVRLAACGERGARSLAQLRELDGSADIASGSSHGDLNSGNVAVVEGPCPLWDWERFEQDVPPGFDLLHHDLHHAIAVAGKDARRAASELLANAASRLAPLGIPAGASDTTARAYLLTIAQRYLTDRQDDAGAGLGQVDDWLSPALDDHRPRTPRRS